MEKYLNPFFKEILAIFEGQYFEFFTALLVFSSYCKIFFLSGSQTISRNQTKTRWHWVTILVQYTHRDTHTHKHTHLEWCTFETVCRGKKAVNRKQFVQVKLIVTIFLKISSLLTWVMIWAFAFLLTIIIHL